MRRCDLHDYQNDLPSPFLQRCAPDRQSHDQNFANHDWAPAQKTSSRCPAEPMREEVNEKRRCRASGCHNCCPSPRTEYVMENPAGGSGQRTCGASGCHSGGAGGGGNNNIILVAVVVVTIIMLIITMVVVATTVIS